MSKASSTQIGGSHYKDYAIQPYEFITRNALGFLEGCVIKRMCRWRAKNGIEDLRKAIHEIELLIEGEEGAKTDTAPAELPLRACDCQYAGPWPDGSPAQCRCASMATLPVQGANPDLPGWVGANLYETPPPASLPDGTIIYHWVQSAGQKRVGFMHRGQVVWDRDPR